MRNLIFTIFAALMLVFGIGSPAEAAGPRVATRAEYKKLKDGMSYNQVKRILNAPRKQTGYYPLAILVRCPSDGEFFCTDANGAGTGTITAVGSRKDFEWYTGRDKYDGRKCYSIYTEFYQGADGVWRLRSKENWRNVCGTRYNS